MAQRRRRAGLRARRGSTSWGPNTPTVAQATSASSPAGTPRRRRRWPWIVLAVGLVLLVPVGYYGYGIVSTLFTISPGNGAGPIEAVAGPQAEAPAGTTYILLMGSDERRDKN